VRGAQRDRAAAPHAVAVRHELAGAGDLVPYILTLPLQDVGRWLAALG
jgi:hypothetical protein